MKKWKIILASVLALLVLVVTPLSIMAAAPDAVAKTFLRRPRVHLAIVQPRLVAVGQTMQLTVFERLNQTPAPEASVWAVTHDKAETVKQAVQALNAQGRANVTIQDYEAVLNTNCTLLGQTAANGKLTQVFGAPADYWLIALKAGFLPAFSHLSVRDVLAISAPQKAAPGEAVTITVNQRETAAPVGGVGVWAVEFANARALKDGLAEIRQANRGNLQDVDWAAALNNLAISLGATDANGQVTGSFEEGSYLLIAALKGCLPAYSRINIAAPHAVVPAADIGALQ